MNWRLGFRDSGSRVAVRVLRSESADFLCIGYS